MEPSEFDKYADEYRAMHAASIGAAGEEPEYFAEYKVRDLRDSAKLSNPSGSPHRILDFGAGVGSCTGFLLRYFPQAEVVGADVSFRSLQVGAHRHREASWVRIGESALPFRDDSFDRVLAACVFHHIDASRHVDRLAELRRVLRPDGMLLLYEHNPSNPLTRRAVRLCPFDEHAVLIPADRMRASCVAAGFSSVALRYRVFFPRSLGTLRWLEPALSWLPLGAQYALLARK